MVDQHEKITFKQTLTEKFFKDTHADTDVIEIIQKYKDDQNDLKLKQKEINEDQRIFLREFNSFKNYFFDQFDASDETFRKNFIKICHYFKEYFKTYGLITSDQQKQLEEQKKKKLEERKLELIKKHSEKRKSVLNIKNPDGVNDENNINEQDELIDDYKIDDRSDAQKLRDKLIEGDIDNQNDAYKFCQTIEVEVPKKDFDPTQTMIINDQAKTILEMAGNCQAKIQLNFLQNIPKRCKKWSTEQLKHDLENKQGPEEGLKRYNNLYKRILAGPEQVSVNYSPENYIIENKEDQFTAKRVNNYERKFDESLIYFLSSVMYKKFDSTKHQLIDIELNRIFRTTFFNFAERDQIHNKVIEENAQVNHQVKIDDQNNMIKDYDNQNTKPKYKFLYENQKQEFDNNIQSQRGQKDFQNLIPEYKNQKMKNIINLRSPIVEQILPGKDKCLDTLTKQYQFQRTIPDKTQSSMKDLKIRSRSSENLGITSNQRNSRVNSGRMVMNNNNTRNINAANTSNMTRNSSNHNLGFRDLGSRESKASFNMMNNDIKNLNKKSQSNLHNVQGMNVNELRTMQTNAQQDFSNENDWFKEKFIRDFIGDRNY